VAEVEVAAGGDGRIAALKQDVQGRMAKALMGKARFDRWGKHYLRALMRAHQLQVCTNFMDPGLQIYGGSLFKQTRDRGDTVFLELAPPAPQKVLYQPYQPVQPTYIPGVLPAGNGGGGGGYPLPAAAAARPAPAQTNMQTYYAGSGGGCFGGDATVIKVSSGGGDGDEGLATTATTAIATAETNTIANTNTNTNTDTNTNADSSSSSSNSNTSGTAPAKRAKVAMPVSQIRAGDVVEVADGGVATVLFAVRIARSPNRSLCRLGGSGLIITPGHPIRLPGASGEGTGRWVRPADGAVAMEMVGNPSGFVYTLVVDRCHVVPVNGVHCVTWGHGIVADGAVAHPFLGSLLKVAKNLRRLQRPGCKVVQIDGCVRDCDGHVAAFTRTIDPHTDSDSNSIRTVAAASSTLHPISMQ
jgi:hypothetical protein